MSFKRFDVATELQNLRSTPPKAAKPPKAEEEISHFRWFRWTTPTESQNPPEPVAATWLRSKLSSPQHIAPLIAEWVGERDGSTGRWIDDLIEARWTLGVVAYVGEDDRLWWQLPQTTVQ